MEKSFEILIDEHRDMMLNYASALLYGDAHQAEDVVQEACIAAYKHLDRFETGRSFSKWLRGIVRNKALESKRSSCRRPFIEDPDVIEGLEEVYLMFDKQKADETWNERLSYIRRCINKLNEPMRHVVELFYDAELSLKSIAERLQINPMTAGQRLSRSRKMVRNCVSMQLQEEGI
jgi:RNA polymerase sigma-70 factor (ECF subfamily)